MPDEEWPSYPENDPRWIDELRRRSHRNRQLLGHLELEVARLEKENERLERRQAELRERLRERNAEVVKVISHTVIVALLIGAAVTLTVTGNDATYAWSALAAYGIGAGVERTSTRTAKG